jgi:hypothetical protein
MDAADRIDAYLGELERQLRLPRRARRRILSEVRAHLLDAAAAERRSTTEASCAAERAVLRFGLAAETAGQFNRRAGRRSALLRRAVVSSIAAFAVTSTAATVWAFGPGPAPSQARRAPDRLAQRPHYAAPTVEHSQAHAPLRDAQRSSLPTASRKRAAGRAAVAKTR